MNLAEKLIKSHEVFSGRLLHVFDDEVELPNGNTSRREIVRHQGGACVCAIDKDLQVAFVRQFRYPYGRDVLEIPAGKVEVDEAPYACAMRELHEETGLVTEQLLPLGTMYPSPGYTDEIIYLFLAINVSQERQDLDPDEFVNVERIHLGTALEMVLRGEIPDGKTQVALLKAYIMLNYLSESAEAQIQAEAE